MRTPTPSHSCLMRDGENMEDGICAASKCLEVGNARCETKNLQRGGGGRLCLIPVYGLFSKKYGPLLVRHPISRGTKMVP